MTRPYHTDTPQHTCSICGATFTPNHRSRMRVKPGTVAILEYICPQCSHPGAPRAVHAIYRNTRAHSRAEGNK